MHTKILTSACIMTLKIDNFIKFQSYLNKIHLQIYAI